MDPYQMLPRTTSALETEHVKSDIVMEVKMRISVLLVDTVKSVSRYECFGGTYFHVIG